MWDSLVNCQYICLMDWCKQMSAIAACKRNRFHESRDLVRGLFELYNAEDEGERQWPKQVNGSCEGGPSNLCTCKTKGRSG